RSSSAMPPGVPDSSCTTWLCQSLSYNVCIFPSTGIQADLKRIIPQPACKGHSDGSSILVDIHLPYQTQPDRHRDRAQGESEPWSQSLPGIAAEYASHRSAKPKGEAGIKRLASCLVASRKKPVHQQH